MYITILKKNDYLLNKGVLIMAFIWKGIKTSEQSIKRKWKGYQESTLGVVTCLYFPKFGGNFTIDTQF